MIHFLINGFPLYFSDTDTPLPGATATLRPWIVDGGALIQSISHNIEPWGGCVQSGGVSVVLSDADLSLSRILPIRPPARQIRCLEHIVMPTVVGQVLVDVSDNTDLSVGEILQCPYDAWEILHIAPVGLPSGIYCQRGIHSCFPGSAWIYQPYYQRGVGQGELFSFGRSGIVPELDGRTCTLWIDGEIAWIGVATGLSQQGPRWTVQCRHVLGAWRDKFTPDGLPSFGLNHDVFTGGGAWWQGRTVPPDGLRAHPAIGAQNVPYYHEDDGWSTLDRRGLSYLGGGEPPEIVDRADTRATRAALGDGLTHDPNLDRYVTQPLGTPEYGWIDDPDMYIGIQGPISVWMTGHWLTCPDGIARTVRKKIVEVLYDTIRLDQFALDENGDIIDGRAGFSSAGPIYFSAAPIVSAPSIPLLFYRLLVSTGSNQNGEHDRLPGYLGLGLPADLIDDRISYLLHDPGPVTAVDLGEANLSEELEAAGCWLLWTDGKFSIQEVQPPVLLSARTTVDGEILATQTPPNVNRAYVAPIMAVTYEDARGDKMTLNIRSPQIYRPTSSATKELHSKIMRGLPANNAIGTLSAMAHWLSRYAPCLHVDLIPTHGLSLGQTVLVRSPYIAGVGDWYGMDVPGLVVGVTETGADLLLNTLPDADRILSPALRVTGWTGNVIAVLGGALEWMGLMGLDGKLALHDETTGDVQDAAIITIESDTQIILKDPVTLTPGDSIILTLPPYTDVLPLVRNVYCFLADSGGELYGEPGHEYV